MNGVTQRAEIERQILLYLLGHPAAKDTLAGIFEWWLKAPQHWSQNEVEEVIEDLISRRWMTITELKTGIPLFGMNPDAHGAITRATRDPDQGEEDPTWRT